MFNPSIYIIVTLVLICLLIVVNNYNYMMTNRICEKQDYKFFLIFIPLFCTLFCSGWDYYGYWMTFNVLNSYDTQGYEDLCYKAMNILPNSYRLWRLVIWGGATIITVMVFKMLQVDSKLALLLFIMLPLIQTFYVSRNTLGISMVMLAMARWGGYRKTNLWNIVIIVLIVSLSTLFHKSMPLYIAILVLAMFVPYNKAFVIGSLVAFPILYMGINRYGAMFLNLDFLQDTATRNAGFSYLLREDGGESLTLIGKITYAIERIPMAIILVYSTYHIVFKKQNVDSWQKNFLIYAYILFYLSYLFYDQSSIFLHTRFWGAAQYPLSIFLTGYLIDKRQSPVVKAFFYTLMISFLYTIVYKVYSWHSYTIL